MKTLGKFHQTNIFVNVGLSLRFFDSGLCLHSWWSKFNIMDRKQLHKKWKSTTRKIFIEKRICETRAVFALFWFHFMLDSWCSYTFESVFRRINVFWKGKRKLWSDYFGKEFSISFLGLIFSKGASIKPGLNCIEAHKNSGREWFYEQNIWFFKKEIKEHLLCGSFSKHLGDRLGFALAEFTTEVRS